MKLFDIYKDKATNEIIQISSFATRMNTSQDMIIIFERVERYNEFEIGVCPSFNGYGTKEEIEEEYEILVTQEDLRNYETWDDIFALVENK